MTFSTLRKCKNRYLLYRIVAPHIYPFINSNRQYLYTSKCFEYTHQILSTLCFGTVLVSYGRCNKLPQTGSLKTTEIYPHNFGGQKSELKVAEGLHCPWKLQGRTLPFLFQLPVAVGIPCSCITPGSTFIVLSPLCVSVSSLLSLLRFVIGFRVYSGSPR